MKLLLAGIVGALVGAGIMQVVDVGHPSVGDLRVAALVFESCLRDARVGVRQRCGALGWYGEKERALRNLSEQEAAFNFAVISMHAYDTRVGRDYDRIAKDMKAFRAELDALRCD